jgi:uncharacterized surface protein with fasciclin (FAS1) repeats
MKTLTLKITSALLATFLLVGCGSDDDEVSVPDIVEVAQGDDRFDTLVAAVVEADLVDTLKAEGPYTVFAPTDDAFEAYLTENSITASDLLANPALASILTYHVLPQEVLAAAAISVANSATNTVTTVNGETLALTTAGDDLYINGSKVVVADVTAENGVIHAIDKVLVPPAMSASLDIVGTAQADDRFDTLVAAVSAASLVTTLQGDGPFTVFAPTDDAFTAYLTENDLTAQELLASEALGDILTYHVLAGKVIAGAAVAKAGSTSDTAATINGANLALSLTGDALKVNTSEVIVADVMTTNGVIHAIDKVLVPPAASSLSNTNVTVAGLVTALAGDAQNPEFTTLLAAVQTADDAVLTTLNDATQSLTVFAPTDAAFATLLSDLGLTAQELLASEALTDVLLQHVVGAEIDSVMAYAANGSEVATLNSNYGVNVSIQNGDLFIEGAKVVITDVEVSNGVIHVIDTVIPSVLSAPAQ